MGYYLQAFICKQGDGHLLTNKYDKAVKMDIGQGIALILMTEELFDQINNFSSSASIDKFEYMTENIEQRVLDAINGKKFAYVEAEYFGGEGGQIAILWNHGRREQLLPIGQDKINRVLKDFGVTANEGQDEFLTIGLGLNRNTKDWIENVD